MDGDEPEVAPCKVQLNRVPRMLGDDHILFQRAVTQENVHQRLNEEEIEEAEAKAVDPNSIVYMEAPKTE